jgi:hypothetical protein
MTLKKRGLGRGLEVLLTEAPALEGLQQTQAPLEDTDAQALIEMVHTEYLALLQEAEDLKKMLDEFESMIRAELR